METDKTYETDEDKEEDKMMMRDLINSVKEHPTLTVTGFTPTVNNKGKPVLTHSRIT